MEYVHFSPHEDLGYELTEETLEYNGSQILYLLTELKEEFVLGCDQSVVTPSQTRTVMVKGYIKKWKYKHNENGAAISEVKPIGEDAKREIIELIESRQGTANIYFG